jgi:hypothetical protein
MLPERMRARRASSGGEAGGAAIVAAHGSIAAGPNAGTTLTTRHVDPTPSAAFALNSAKAGTALLRCGGALLCCCGARVCKGCNREKADGRQITHCFFPCVDGLQRLPGPDRERYWNHGVAGAVWFSEFVPERAAPYHELPNRAACLVGNESSVRRWPTFRPRPEGAQAQSAPGIQPSRGARLEGQGGPCSARRQEHGGGSGSPPTMSAGCPVMVRDAAHDSSRSSAGP